MQVRSSSLPQGSTLVEIKGLLELISDPKKIKKTLEDLSSDISDFQEAYKINNEQLENIEKQKTELMSGFEKLKFDSLDLEQKQNKYLKEFSELDEKLQNFLTKEKELKKEININKLLNSEACLKLKEDQNIANKKYDESIISLNKSDALIAEYEAKLNRMKEMVG